MDLERYRSKRHADRTPEPFENGQEEPGKQPIFVVQRHSARRLHYDLRLERDGVLQSWALPRGVPLRAGERALAVHVEDHPLEYASFEGEIPAGEYGGGTVDIWDRGTYELVHERPDGTLTVIMHGQRLEGEWALVPAKLDGKEKNWLIVRASKMGAPGPQRKYKPMRARPAKRIPSGADWAFEIAWEGARALAYVEGAKGRFEHDQGEALHARCGPLLARMPRALRTSDCVIDGVICALDDQGVPRRALLADGGGTLVYMVFDVLEYEAKPQVRLAWSTRRTRLLELLDERVDDLRLSRSYDDGRQLRDSARGLGLGIIAKRVGGRYREGVVSDDWRELGP
jgi:bifunctional non-homologous end joining protein LigD